MLQILSVVFYVFAAICAVVFITSIGNDNELASFLLPLYGGSAITLLFFGGVCSTLHSIDTSLKSIAENTASSRGTPDNYTQNRRNTDFSVDGAEADSTGGDQPDEHSLMEQFGIARDGDQFIYKTFRYEKLSDAINYATLDERRNRR